MNRAVIYARYSSNNQTEQSIEGQIRECTKYAKQHKLKVIDSYIDRAISGRTDNRPEFQRLIADSAKHIFDAVIVYKTDRLSRSKNDSAIYKTILKKNGIKLHYAAESIPEGPEGVLIESLMEGIAEYYSLELSQKIRRGLNESALKCNSTGGMRALGYRPAPDKSIQIDPDEAKLVQTIFDKFVQGGSNAEICRYLNSIGAKTIQGRDFNKNSINRIIKNEKYVGVYKYKDIKVEGGLPAIISKDVFDLAQRELKHRTTSKQATLPRADYLLVGKLFCGHCGRGMTGVSGTGKSGRKFYYYYCPESRAKGTCKKKQVTKSWVENAVVEETIRHVLNPKIIDHLVEAIYEKQVEANKNDSELKFYKKKLAENKKAIDNVFRLVEQGNTMPLITERLNDLEAERGAIKGEIFYLQKRQFALTKGQIEYAIRGIMTPHGDPEEFKQQIISRFISEVYLHDDKLLLYYNTVNENGKIDTSGLDITGSEVFDERIIISTTRSQQQLAQIKYLSIILVGGLGYFILCWGISRICYYPTAHI